MLIVEDDPGSRTALRYIVLRAGHEVSTAATVAEAMEALRSSTPDLVVLDLMLPDGDGTTVLQFIRSSDTPDIAVAVTTGVMDPQWLERVRALRPQSLMSKPIKIDELLALL